MFKRHIIFFCILLLALTSCSPEPSLTETNTNILPSPTPSRNGTPTSSATLIPNTPTFTIQPISGLALWQLNVRSGPGVQYTLIGKINQGENLQILGVDPSGDWLMIVFGEGPGEQAWITAEYVEYPEVGNLPIVGLVTLYNGTPAPQGSISEKLNVRQGPGTQFESLGILPADAAIWIIGRNIDGSWLLIDYPSASDGEGWIISGYVIVQDIMGLPVMDSAGDIIQETPGVQSGKVTTTPTAGILIAANEHDSIDEPAVSIEISSIGTDKFRFTSDLSQPNGDHSDWIKVQYQGSNQSDSISLSASLSCNGNGAILIQLFKDDQKVSNWGVLSCGDQNQLINIKAGIQYIFQFEIISQPFASYVDYKIELDLKQK
jgi:uncharacterized protein YraI